MSAADEHRRRSDLLVCGVEVRGFRTPGFLRASELGVSAMPTCIFAAHAGPSEAKLGGVTKASFLVGLRPPRTPILTMDRRRTAVLSGVPAAHATP
jgi:hypothetical protein